MHAVLLLGMTKCGMLLYKNKIKKGMYEVVVVDTPENIIPEFIFI